MKVLNKAIFLVAVLLSACGSKNEQKEIFVEKDSSNPLDSELPPMMDFRRSNETFATYCLIDNMVRMVRLSDKKVQLSGKQVIVNAANEWMAYDESSGAHQEIVTAAGIDIIDAEVQAQKGRYFKTIGGKDDLGGSEYILNPGEAMTTSAGNLKSQGTKYIIHAVGPRFGSEVSEKANTLKTTYESVFTEMNTLHQSDTTMTSLALMPISSGVFNGGDQNIPAIYDILISSTIDAMRKYEWLQPSIYTYNKENLELMKTRVMASKQFYLFAEGSGSSSVTSSAAIAATTTSKLALLSTPAYASNFGSINIQGAAVSFGSMRVMGNTARGINTQLTQLSVGKMHNAHFLGCEFETAFNADELTSYSIKAVALTHFSDNIKLAGSLGYLCENKHTHLQPNIRHFLNELGIDTAEFKRHGVVGDLSAQYHINISSNISFSGNVGLRATYLQAFQVNPFAQMICQFSGLNVVAALSQAEVGLNLGLNY